MTNLPAHDGPPTPEAWRWGNDPRHPWQTLEDPTGGGFYCGSGRSRRQMAAEGDDGHPHCRVRAGWGTDHAGVGRCKLHGGASPAASARARLRMAELVEPAIAVLVEVITSRDEKTADRLRAAEAVFDRVGMARRLDIDLTAGREALTERIMEELARAEVEGGRPLLDAGEEHDA